MFVNLKLDLASNIESVPKIMVQFCSLGLYQALELFSVVRCNVARPKGWTWIET